MTTSLIPPPGANWDKCPTCDRTVWSSQLSDETARRAHKLPNTRIYLAPRSDSTGGVIIRNLTAYYVNNNNGNYAVHHCPNQTATCKYCGETILVLHSPPGSRERLMVLDPESHEDGLIAITKDGYAVRDEEREMPGPHYYWHRKH